MKNNTIPRRVQDRYDRACSLCYEKHLRIFDKDKNCEYLKNKQYCPEIMEAEKARLSKEVLSPHMEEYLANLKTHGYNRGYKYIRENIGKFTQNELLAIICAFDYLIYPHLMGNFEIERINKAYTAVDEFVRNEFLRGYSSCQPN